MGPDYRDMVLRCVANFPGLVLEAEEVNGADLVEWWTQELHAIRSQDAAINVRAYFGSPEEEE